MKRIKTLLAILTLSLSFTLSPTSALAGDHGVRVGLGFSVGNGHVGVAVGEPYGRCYHRRHYCGPRFGYDPFYDPYYSNTVVVRFEKKHKKDKDEKAKKDKDEKADDETEATETEATEKEAAE